MQLGRNVWNGTHRSCLNGVADMSTGEKKRCRKPSENHFPINLAAYSKILPHMQQTILACIINCSACKKNVHLISQKTYSRCGKTKQLTPQQINDERQQQDLHCNNKLESQGHTDFAEHAHYSAAAAAKPLMKDPGPASALVS